MKYSHYLKPSSLSSYKVAGGGFEEFFDDFVLISFALNDLFKCSPRKVCPY